MELLRCFPASLCVLLSLISPAFGAGDRPAPLDPALAKRISALAEHWWRARPPTRCVDWDPKARAELEAEARALPPLPENALESVVALLWADARKLGPQAERKGDWITIQTPYGVGSCILDGGGKRPSVVIGLHGGGAEFGEAGEARSDWKLKGGLCLYPQIVRLQDDAWNSVHGERLVLSFLEVAKVQYDADPDRVYVMGFSMGGSGAWFLAGRHPDLFAGAAPFAGVLMARPKSQVETKEEVESLQPGLVPNVFNLAMHYTIGLQDPNARPGTYLFAADLLEQLRRKYPGGYQKIYFQAFDKLVDAFPPGEPQKAFQALYPERRATFPAEIVWEANEHHYPLPEAKDPVGRMAKKQLYWLGCRDVEDCQLVHAVRERNRIRLEVSHRLAGTKGLTIFLRGDQLDPAQDVTVEVEERVVYRGRPQPDVWTVLETLDDKLDRSLVFDRRIDL